MISAKKGIFHIKNRETGEFEPIVAVKGDKGDGADIVAMDKYFTTETGDSEELVMTQKGVTDLHSDIVNGETKVGVATLAEKANEADLAEHATTATGDAKGNTIDKTYAKLTQVNGTVLSTNILEEAVRLVGNGDTCKVEHRYINISDAEWLKGDFDIPEGLARYGYVTFFIRYGSVTVWLWGAVGSNAYYNSYTTSTGKWIGWRKVIDSKNIGEQSVSHAKTADNANTANRATKITASVTDEDAEHLVYLTGKNDASVMKYDTAFKYNPSTRTLTVPNIIGIAASAQIAGHALDATTATKATQDAKGNVIDETYATKNAASAVIVGRVTVSNLNTLYTIDSLPTGKTINDIVGVTYNGEVALLNGIKTKTATNNQFTMSCSGLGLNSSIPFVTMEYANIDVVVEDGKVKIRWTGIKSHDLGEAHITDKTKYTETSKYIYVHFK